MTGSCASSNRNVLLLLAAVACSSDTPAPVSDTEPSTSDACVRFEARVRQHADALRYPAGVLPLRDSMYAGRVPADSFRTVLRAAGVEQKRTPADRQLTFILASRAAKAAADAGCPPCLAWEEAELADSMSQAMFRADREVSLGLDFTLRYRQAVQEAARTCWAIPDSLSSDAHSVTSWLRESEEIEREQTFLS